jgi:hypothetical protein
MALVSDYDFVQAQCLLEEHRMRIYDQTISLSHARMLKLS